MVACYETVFIILQKCKDTGGRGAVQGNFGGFFGLRVRVRKIRNDNFFELTNRFLHGPKKFVLPLNGRRMEMNGWRKQVALVCLCLVQSAAGWWSGADEHPGASLEIPIDYPQMGQALA